ncbi:MAG TPA: hypothetical protein VL635_18935 [Trinickia sp.]|jgi:hypothetical protein|nr:hypothetical protein [Trinickia sp.]
MKRVLAVALFIMAGFAAEARHPLKCDLIAASSAQTRRRRG